MSELAEQIIGTKVRPGTVGIFFIGQAGFVFKTSAGRIVDVDPYLSDSCNRLFGIKRLYPSPIRAEEIKLDSLIVTHEHADHLDEESVSTIAASNRQAVFAGPATCLRIFQGMQLTVPMTLLKVDEPVQLLPDVKVLPMPCDHGKDTPDALGLLLEIEGIRIYIPGDTVYREDIFRAAAGKNVDVMIPAINGNFGNLDSEQAARAIQIVQPKLAIPCHFWMSIQHGGDPGSFLAACEKLKLESKILVMAVGEKFVYPE